MRSPKRPAPQAPSTHAADPEACTSDNKRRRRSKRPASAPDHPDHAASAAHASTLNPPNHRRILTRSRTRIFRFLDLPPELRNLIYDFAFAGVPEPVPLQDLRLPPSLRACRALYAEARPLFFLATPVAARVRCNWCVRFHHLHSEHHLRYDETGRLGGRMPEMLSGDGAVSSEIARFRHVRFEVQCCCCDLPKVIANFWVRVLAGGDGGLGIVARREVMGGKICVKVLDGLERMFEGAHAVMRGIEKREGFSGLTVGDLEAVARCFREEGEVGSDSGSDL